MKENESEKRHREHRGVAILNTISLGQRLANYGFVALHLFLYIKFYWHTAILICKLSVTAFMLQQQSSIAAAETVWVAKPKIFTIWPFTESIYFLALCRENADFYIR